MSGRAPTGGTFHHPRGLRHALLAVVLVNLAFVQLTGAVGTHWLLPLWLLTAIAPWTARWQPRLLYRALWNGSVLGVFALLVHHATSGIRFLLEDGLMLAALCQVHLLNNLSRQQRPDLLFFNSFLIALVTSFFCQDVAYAALFIVYVTVLLMAMTLAHAARFGTRVDRAQLRDAMLRGVVVIGLTLGGFALLPRDFEREGLVAEHLLSQQIAETGFSETVKLGQSGAVVQSDRVVMRIRVVGGDRAAVPTLWRGATFDRFEANRWRTVLSGPAHGRALDPQWLRQSDTELYRPGPRADAVTQLDITLEDTESPRLFAPLEADRIRVADEAFASANHDGTVSILLDHRRDAQRPLHYRLGLRSRALEHADHRARHTSRAVLPYIELLGRTMPRAARRLCRRVVRRIEGAPPHALVEALRAELANNGRYALPGEPDAARNLTDFFERGTVGHCEYFATALALMLRSEGIPARMVTGYLCSEWSADRTEIVVRRRHAHAWVEVLDPNGFWYAVDATPAAEGAGDAEPGLLAGARAWIGGLWTRLTTFNDDARAAAFAWLRAAPRQLATWGLANPLQALLWALSIAAAVLGLRRRRRRRHHPAVWTYARAIARAKVRLLPGETPRELMQRVRAAGLPPAVIAELEAVTETHERQRYANPAPVPGRDTPHPTPHLRRPG